MATLSIALALLPAASAGYLTARSVQDEVALSRDYLPFIPGLLLFSLILVCAWTLPTALTPLALVLLLLLIPPGAHLSHAPALLSGILLGLSAQYAPTALLTLCILALILNYILGILAKNHRAALTHTAVQAGCFLVIASL